jgi:hypothetical protein
MTSASERSVSPTRVVGGTINAQIAPSERLAAAASFSTDSASEVMSPAKYTQQ